MTQPLFDKLALIGIGLIGGSIALAARRILVELPEGLRDLNRP